MEFGKFKDATSLLDGYLELEKAFTKKCTELSTLKRRLAESGYEKVVEEVAVGREEKNSHDAGDVCSEKFRQNDFFDGVIQKNYASDVKNIKNTNNLEVVSLETECAGNSLQGKDDFKSGVRDKNAEEVRAKLKKIDEELGNYTADEEIKIDNSVAKEGLKTDSADEDGWLDKAIDKKGLGKNDANNEVDIKNPIIKEGLDNGATAKEAVAIDTRINEGLASGKANKEVGLDKAISNENLENGATFKEVGLGDFADNEGIVENVTNRNADINVNGDGVDINVNGDDVAKVDNGKADFEGDKNINYNVQWRRRVNEFFADNSEAVPFKKEIAKVLLADKSLIDRSDGLMLAYLLAKSNFNKSASADDALDKHGVAPTTTNNKSDKISTARNHNLGYDNYTLGSGFGTFNGDEENRQLLNKLGKSALDDYFEGLLDIKQRSPKFVASENGGGIAISAPSKPRSIADAGKFILKNFF